MKDILYKELESLGAWEGTTSSFFKGLVGINHFSIPVRMKTLIAVSEISSLAAQFKKPIMLPDGTLIPINAIAFCIAKSGSNKDSSLALTRKVFKKAYTTIETKRLEFAKDEAIKLATEAGEDLPEEIGVYRDYYAEPVPLILDTVTQEGFVQYLNNSHKEKLGAGKIINSELADEFNHNGSFPGVLKVLATSYDLGIVGSSFLKTVELRNNGVEGVSSSALFIGSQHMFMHDNTLRTKFLQSFASKLARRSHFVYCPEEISSVEYDSGLEAIKADKRIRDAASQAIIPLAVEADTITTYGLETLGLPITLSDDADTMMLLLHRYDIECAKECANESSDKLYRTHRYWRALKLAGAIALLDKSDEISAHHFSQAITITEVFIEDMALFEVDLNKAPHERFSDYIRTQAGVGHKAVVSAHDLRKRGFTTTSAKTQLTELVTLCTGYDELGLYSLTNNDTAIQYEPIVKTEVVGVSYKEIDAIALNEAVNSKESEDAKAKLVKNAKIKMASEATEGYEFSECTFEDVGDLLSGDYAYSPFKFLDGIRGRDKVVGGTKWLVFDVDDSVLSAPEVHIMLDNINHHIVLTSDPNNEYKFRVILELDSVVELPAVPWKNFYQLIAKDLALNVDVLPQSQIFYSFAGRDLYSQIDAEPLEVRNYLVEAMVLEANKPKTIAPNTKQSKSLLADPLNTFDFLFEAKVGSRSIAVIRALRWAKDLGADLDYLEKLIDDSDEYWYSPTPKSKLLQLKDQAARMMRY